MTDEERTDLRDRLQSYEKLRREQLGTAITLIQGLAAAGVAFCVSHIADDKAQFNDRSGSILFTSATIIFIVTVGLCMLTTFTRLRDFRGTAKKLRAELCGAQDSELKILGEKNRKLGRRTWLLFRAQSVMFFLGVIVLAWSLWLLQHNHLFPKAQPKTEHTTQSQAQNDSARANYVITGSYSVDEGTHVKQMADCKADLKKYVDEIDSNKRQPGETLLFDSSDIVYLRGHICASWAAGPLDKTLLDVIVELGNLESLMMARERVRYENVKAQLDYYKKRFH